MARFMDIHPDVTLHIDASAGLVDFDNEPIDIAIRHFKAQGSSRLDIELLFLGELRVYCRPGYCENWH